MKNIEPTRLFKNVQITGVLSRHFETYTIISTTKLLIGSRYMSPLEPVISIKEARKLLGVDARRLSDDQVGKMIRALQQIADDLLDTSLERPLGA